MKRVIKRAAGILMLFFMMAAFSGCGGEKSNNNKITIITTLFPQYDFARQIAGDKCEVKLLLPPGTDIHSYEPAPKDIIDISSAEIFIYTGDDLEAWVTTILAAIDNKDLKVVDLSENIELLNTGEHEHDHGHEDEANEEKGHEDEAGNEEIFGHNHSHSVDPHFWTSPENAVIMMEEVCEAIVEADPENKEYYQNNCKEYVEKIKDVDNEIRSIVENADIDTLYFGGRFAMLYFTEYYGLSYVSPFDSCSHETEADPKSIVEIIECMKQHKIKTVFKEELADPKIAEMIADEIGGKTLQLHSCHNVSKEDFENGITYVDLMRQNAENLKSGLKSEE